MPSMTRALVVVLLMASVALYVVIERRRLDHAEQRAEHAEAIARQLTADLATERGKERIVTHYVDRVQVVREQGATIVKEVPIYVTQTADDHCIIPVGFVRVHDAAAQAVPVEPGTGDPDAPAAGVTLSTVAGTVADNYTTCHAIREQLIALQDYVRLRDAPP